jgi:NlpC/P60 family
MTGPCTSVISPEGEFCIKLWTMRTPAKPGIATLLCGLALWVCSSELAPGQAATANTAPPSATASRGRKPDRMLTADDGLGVISAALDPKVRRYAGHDCSHLVHAIYQRAGFPYAYAGSDDLYDGVQGFQRITQPQPGDLIVWHGHVGIVVRPSKHVFFSFMTAGPGIDDYEASYWVNRGQPRFYRYVKNNACAGCAAVSTTFRHTPRN